MDCVRRPTSEEAVSPNTLKKNSYLPISQEFLALAMSNREVLWIPGLLSQHHRLVAYATEAHALTALRPEVLGEAVGRAGSF